LWTALAENGIHLAPEMENFIKSNSVNRISFYYDLQMYTSKSTNKHVILPKDLS